MEELDAQVHYLNDGVFAIYPFDYSEEVFITNPVIRGTICAVHTFTTVEDDKVNTEECYYVKFAKDRDMGPYSYGELFTTYAAAAEYGKLKLQADLEKAKREYAFLEYRINGAIAAMELEQ